MENNRAALLLNGDYKNEEFYKNIFTNYKFIVCADGAGNIMYHLKITPNIILGDLDSITNETLEYFKNLNVTIERFPPEKDYTDSQLGLLKLKELGYKYVDIYGGFGSRMDHTLGNIGLIYWGYKEGVDVSLVDENNKLTGLKIGKTYVEEKENKVFSIIANFEDLQGLSIENAKYPLNKYSIKKGVPLGISNEFLHNEAVITLKQGFGLLCIANKI